ncbi:MAG TPA: hypothetical protein VJU13_06690 [Candidatus Nitrosocosmicus sp.]|nr:hypothetical protein [Candidatus Nitrosocosmicus sp.]
MSAPETIMVVEDEKELASLFKAFLERMAYYTLTFTDSIAALFQGRVSVGNLLITLLYIIENGLVRYS